MERGAGETRVPHPPRFPCEGGMQALAASGRRVRSGLLHETRVHREISGHDEGAAPVFTLVYLRVK